MSKVDMTFQVEMDLRTSFEEAAKQEHREVEQVFSELMKDYVARTPKQRNISAEERARRQEAVKFATASIALEGLEAPEEYNVEAQRFVEGEIEFGELTEFVQKLAQKHPLEK